MREYSSNGVPVGEFKRFLEFVRPNHDNSFRAPESPREFREDAELTTVALTRDALGRAILRPLMRYFN